MSDRPTSASDTPTGTSTGHPRDGAAGPGSTQGGPWARPDLVDEARGIGADPGSALAQLPRLLEGVPLPGEGATHRYLAGLAALGAGDLTVARTAEPHLDAAAILTQAGRGDLLADATTWGVFAAEAPGARLTARHTDDGWTLTGVKPWCSLASLLTHAVVTAHTGPDTRRAFAVTLRDPGVTVVAVDWASRGLAALPSGPVEFADVPAVPVGEDGWYLDRPGFAWGGIGVAAVWFGGAHGVAQRLHTAARTRTPDQIAAMHIGTIDVALHGAGCVLAEAARSIDAGSAAGALGAMTATRVRSVVAAAAEETLARVGHACG